MLVRYCCTAVVLQDKKKEKKVKDPYSKTAQEKARLEAQQRLMGIDAKRKKAKKKMLGMGLLI